MKCTYMCMCTNKCCHCASPRDFVSLAEFIGCNLYYNTVLDFNSTGDYIQYSLASARRRGNAAF